MTAVHSSTERRVGMVIEYDGTEYSGFQKQTKAPTVQCALEEALARLTGEQIRVKGASRTDSGAHALGQVVAFSTDSSLPLEAFVKGPNAHLPREIAVLQAHLVPTLFDPRRDATSRVYRYTILNQATRSPSWERWAYQVPGQLDLDAMSASLRSLEGSHDFAPFGGAVPLGKSTIRRIISTQVIRYDNRVLVEIEGNAFLPGQVRRTVGTLLKVGKGKLSPETVRGIIDGSSDQRATTAVPAKGLCLVKIKYKDFPPNGYKTNENL